MFASRKKLFLGLAGAATAAVVFLGGGVAGAVLTGISGSYVERNLVRTESATYTNSSAANTWQPVPGLSQVVTIAANTRRSFDASYSAESLCSGGTGYCSVRIVAIKSGVVTELNPVASLNYAFDSVDTDRWEGHAFNRTSDFLAAGTYTVRVEAAKVGTVTTLQLDEQHFKVGVLRTP